MRALVMLVALALLVANACPDAVSAARRRPARPSIVVLRADLVGARAVGAAAALGRAHRLDVTHVYGAALAGFAAAVPDAELARLRRDPRVSSVEPDYPVEAFGEVLPTGADRIGADAAAEGALPTRAGAPVAVLDTGIDPDHPDLNVAGGHDCTSPDPAAWADRNGHGTFVAGVVGAKRDGQGMVGVAPGTSLWAVKVLDDRGRGRWSSVICGLDWVVRNAGPTGIAVANLSLGGRRPGDAPARCASSALHRAVCGAAARGVRLVAAAGNDGRDAGAYVPAMYAQVTTVSAVADSDGCAGGLGLATSAGADDALYTRSNFGRVVDVAAPGVDIVSTWPGGGYRAGTGTSAAAPHAAAAYALGWDGTEEARPIPGDRDGFDEGIVVLGSHTVCVADAAGNGVGHPPRDGHRHDRRAG